METLQTRVQREGPLDAADAVGWVVRLAKRIEELHRMGVAHGCLSASCILSPSRKPSGPGELADVRQAAMRPSFHSPERLAGQGISPADDTWAAAVTLYYLLTGSLPFPGKTAQQMRERMASAPPAPLAVFDAGDDELQQLLDRFLARERGRREPRLTELLLGLQRWLRVRRQGDLPPLAEVEDDSFSDADDEEEIATVMRDIGDVRQQLRELQQQRGNSGPARETGIPRPGARPSVPPPPVPPQPKRVGGSLAPPRGHAPVYPAPPTSQPDMFPIEDDDSDAQSTMLMDTDGTEIGDAIAAAVAAKQAQAAGEEDLGGATVLMTDHMDGLDLSGVPDPTGGEPARHYEKPESWSEPDSLPAPPPIDDPVTFGDAPSVAAIESSIDAVAANVQRPAPPPTAMFPEGYQSEVDRILAGQPAHPPSQPMRGPSVEAEAPKSGSGVRAALVVSSILLVLVVAWIGLLLAERAGIVSLPF